MQEIEDSKKSELDKANERAAAAEKLAAESTSALVRHQVAAAKGLSEAQAKRLVGATREELEADADDLLASFKVEQPKKATEVIPGKPKDGASPGESGEIDPQKLAAELLNPRR